MERNECYDLGVVGNHQYKVSYEQRSMEHEDGTKVDLDALVRLEEEVADRYEVPSLGPCGHRNDPDFFKGHKVSGRLIRQVMKELSFSQGFTQISQFADISNLLMAEIKTLPDHVRTLLLTEYKDKGITPYDFGENFPDQ